MAEITKVEYYAGRVGTKEKYCTSRGQLPGQSKMFTRNRKTGRKRPFLSSIPIVIYGAATGNGGPLLLFFPTIIPATFLIKNMPKRTA